MFSRAITKRLRARQHGVVSLLAYLFRGDYTDKYIYVSHHKCATQYTLSILLDVCRLKKLPAVKCDWRKKISPTTLRLNEFIMIQDHGSDIVDIEAMKGRGFHVIRDPRDILVSMYFSHKNSHVVTDPRAEEILRNREELSRLDHQAGLRYLMDSSKYFHRVIREMSLWDYEAENFYETSFEKLTGDPFAEFDSIFKFLSLHIDASDLEKILERNSFDWLKKTWSLRHPEMTGSHYRKGRAGDWKNHLLGENKRIFKQRHGELLIRLGYEKNNDW